MRWKLTDTGKKQAIIEDLGGSSNQALRTD